LTMTPILIPSLLVRRFWRAEVFPEPRKPARRVMGIGGLGGVVVGSVWVEKRRVGVGWFGMVVVVRWWLCCCCCVFQLDDDGVREW